MKGSLPEDEKEVEDQFKAVKGDMTKDDGSQSSFDSLMGEAPEKFNFKQDMT